MQEFYFYLTLEDDHQVIQLPTGRFDSRGIRRLPSRPVCAALPAALHAPWRWCCRAAARGMPGMPPQGHSFGTLQQSVSQDHSIVIEDLATAAWTQPPTC
jgi:ABC-2 type transport system permease protein